MKGSPISPRLAGAESIRLTAIFLVGLLHEAITWGLSGVGKTFYLLSTDNVVVFRERPGDWSFLG